MARKKVKLEWIANDAARRATFKKRRKGLMKKVSELSTLCDVKACLIVYGHNETSPEVWPSTTDAVRVLAKLKRMPEMEQSKKMMNQEGFMRQRIAKLQDQLRKQDRENRELETTVVMNQTLLGMKSLESVGIEEITSLAWLIEMKVNEVKKRVEGCKGESSHAKPPPRAEAKSKAKKASVVVKVEEKMVKVEEPGPAVGPGPGLGTKEKSAMEVAMEELQRQEWFTEIMNPPPPPTYPYGEHGGNAVNGSNTPWMDAYFHLN